MNSMKNARGQSLVEVLIITVIVATILTAIASVVTQSLQTIAENKRKTLATELAQEGLETFRKQRLLLGWESFQLASESGTYCLATLPETQQSFVNLTTGSCDTGELVPGTEFTRQAEVSSSATEVLVIMTVSWDNGETQSVSLRQEFRNIEN